MAATKRCMQTRSSVRHSACACLWWVRRWQEHQVSVHFRQSVKSAPPQRLLQSERGPFVAVKQRKKRFRSADVGPELAAAVANAGGLGFLQSARLPAAQVVGDYKAALGLLDAGIRDPR